MDLQIHQSAKFSVYTVSSDLQTHVLVRTFQLTALHSSPSVRICPIFLIVFRSYTSPTCTASCVVIFLAALAAHDNQACTIGSFAGNPLPSDREVELAQHRCLESRQLPPWCWFSPSSRRGLFFRAHSSARSLHI